MVLVLILDIAVVSMVTVETPKTTVAVVVNQSTVFVGKSLKTFK